ncbi:MAG TPA: hypothetical protein VH373_08005 [Jatrophihabitantaceae bacterium]
MSLQIVRFTTRPEQVADVERGVADLFDALGVAGPDGVRYLAGRVADRPEFLLLLHLDEGVANPLPAIPRAAAFRQQLQDWAAPGPQPVSVLGDYRMTG